MEAIINLKKIKKIKRMKVNIAWIYSQEYLYDNNYNIAMNILI